MKTSALTRAACRDDMWRVWGVWGVRCRRGVVERWLPASTHDRHIRLTRCSYLRVACVNPNSLACRSFAPTAASTDPWHAAKAAGAWRLSVAISGGTQCTAESGTAGRSIRTMAVDQSDSVAASGVCNAPRLTKRPRHESPQRRTSGCERQAGAVVRALHTLHPLLRHG